MIALWLIALACVLGGLFTLAGVALVLIDGWDET